MNGAQDLGGMMGFGAIVGEPEAVPFHAEWEKPAHALMLASSALDEWNLDMVRHARETSSRRLSVVLLLRNLGEGTRKTSPRQGFGDLGGACGRTRAHAAQADQGGACGDRAPSMLASGTPYDRPTKAPARFAIGEEVRAHTIHPKGHTRLPRYVRGRRGHVERVYGVFVFPDANAHGLGESPEWLYGVRFFRRRIMGARGRSQCCRFRRRLGKLSRTRRAVTPRGDIVTVHPAAGGEDGPVFRAPWQTEAFAMTLALHQAGFFSWPEWSSALAREIAAASPDSDIHPSDQYYFHWLAALEKLVVEKGAASTASLAARKSAWDRAAHATPHGAPILLTNDPEYPG